MAVNQVPPEPPDVLEEQDLEQPAAGSARTAVEIQPVELDRQAILNAEDLPMERMDVPEWGGFVYVRTLTGAERDAFEDASIKGRGRNRRFSLRNVCARLVVMAVCDERGRRVFRDGDAERLGEKSAAALNRVYRVAARLSAISEEDIEDLAGNSEGGPSGGSGTS